MPDGIKGYRIYFPKVDKIKIARDVIFAIPQDSDVNNYESKTNGTKDVENFSKATQTEIFGDEVTETFGKEVAETKHNLRDRKKLKSPLNLKDYETNIEELENCVETDMVLLADSVDITVEEALKDNQWKMAIEEEINSLNENETWTITDLPKEKTALDTKWVFKIKRNAEGKIEKYKESKLMSYANVNFGEVSNFKDAKHIIRQKRDVQKI